ncbi:MAG: M48 family metallopeptidase [Bacteroidota bacterium]
MSYKARYENGLSSQPFTVDISLSEVGVSISYTDEEGIFRQEQWLQPSLIEKQVSSSIITLRNGAGVPYKQLEITDQRAIAEYRSLFKQKKQKRSPLPFGSAQGPGRTGRKVVLLIAGILTVLVLSYLYVLPYAADKIAQNFPKDLEISLGDRMYSSILASSTIDSAKTTAINNFFRQLHIESEYPVRITVVKDTIVNAFAVPGGGIVVYDALLKEINEPEALAALLAHEYSHIELKHATRNMFRNVAGYVFISMVLSDANGIASIVLRNTENLRTLKYSRDLEHEADANGLEILKRNHLSPEGMIKLFEQLKEQETATTYEALSTHPELDARIEYVKSYAEKNPFPIEQHDSLNLYFGRLKNNASW